jgi:hypothetical protein
MSLLFGREPYRRKAAKYLLILVIAAIIFCRFGIAKVHQHTEAQKGNDSINHEIVQKDILIIGGYIENISNIDLNDDTFEAELLIWTIWNEGGKQNPSSKLNVLNSVLGQGSGLELIRNQRTQRGDWSLYRLRSKIVQRWQLQDYPFDTQTVYIEIGLRDPVSNITIEIDEETPLQVSPGLQIDGWIIGDANEYITDVRFLSTLGQVLPKGKQTTSQPIIAFDLELKRDSFLYILPDFLGYFLAIGLCSLSLVISRSRDDLILSAVVSSSTNYIFIAEKLPVSAMNGFIGNLQIILIGGILYSIVADEIIDQHLKDYTPRVATTLRYGLLPSYLVGTFIAILIIIP